MIDMRHVSIIDSLPVYESKKKILTVGCGSGNLELALQEMGYDVYATDSGVDEHTKNQRKKNLDRLNFSESNIFDLESFPVKSCESVICSEVLEHIPDWKTAFLNLINLTERRLIITVPYRKCYNVEGPPPDGHCNFWTDLGNDPVNEYPADHFTPVSEFERLAYPYQTTITKVCTKEQDWQSASRCYLIVIDKYQLATYCPTLREASTIFNFYDEEGLKKLRQQTLNLAYPPGGWSPQPYGPPMPYQESTFPNGDIAIILSSRHSSDLNSNLNNDIRKVEVGLSENGFRVVVFHVPDNPTNEVMENIATMLSNNCRATVNYLESAPVTLIDMITNNKFAITSEKLIGENESHYMLEFSHLLDADAWTKIANTIIQSKK